MNAERPRGSIEALGIIDVRNRTSADPAATGRGCSRKHSTPCMRFVAVHESANGRYCCKSPKLPGDNFPATRRTDRRPEICVLSIVLPKSPVNSSSGDEVPHIFTRKSRLQPGEFLISSAKRLLQQNLHKADVTGRLLVCPLSGQSGHGMLDGPDHLRRL